MATQEYLQRFMEAGKRYDELPVRFRLVMSENEWREKVVSFCVWRGYSWSASVARTVCGEGEYYDLLLRWHARDRRIFPHHLADHVTRVGRATAFGYYAAVLAEMIRLDEPYDRLPNVAAADARRVVGVGRNEFIAAVVAAKGRRGGGGVLGVGGGASSSAARAALPKRPVPPALEGWHRLRVVDLTDSEKLNLPEGLRLFVERLGRGGARADALPGGAHDPSSPAYAAFAELYARNLAWYDVPVRDDDRLSVPPLEGFVSNRTSASRADPIETLLYRVFVAAGERVTLRRLAAVLDVDVPTLRVAVSVACRLGFCKRLPRDDERPAAIAATPAGERPQDQAPRATLEGERARDARTAGQEGGGEGRAQGQRGGGAGQDQGQDQGQDRGQDRGQDQEREHPSSAQHSHSDAAAQRSAASSPPRAGQAHAPDPGALDASAPGDDMGAYGTAWRARANSTTTGPGAPGAGSAAAAAAAPSRRLFATLSAGRRVDADVVAAATPQDREAAARFEEEQGWNSFSSWAGAGPHATPGGWADEGGWEDQAGGGGSHLNPADGPHPEGGRASPGRGRPASPLGAHAAAQGGVARSPLSLEGAGTSAFAAAAQAPEAGAREGSAGPGSARSDGAGPWVSADLPKRSLSINTAGGERSAFRPNTPADEGAGRDETPGAAPGAAAPPAPSALAPPQPGYPPPLPSPAAPPPPSPSRLVRADSLSGPPPTSTAIVVDSEVTGYLMMGALTPGCKKHAVTLFEGGRVYGSAVIGELYGELRESVKVAQDFEGEMQALADTARALAAALWAAAQGEDGGNAAAAGESAARPAATAGAARPRASPALGVPAAVLAAAAGPTPAAALAATPAFRRLLGVVKAARDVAQIADGEGEPKRASEADEDRFASAARASLAASLVALFRGPPAPPLLAPAPAPPTSAAFVFPPTIPASSASRVEILRCESMHELPVAAAYRILRASYAAVLPIVGMPGAPLPMSVARPEGPVDLGGVPAARTPWIALALWEAYRGVQDMRPDANDVGRVVVHLEDEGAPDAAGSGARAEAGPPARGPGSPEPEAPRRPRPLPLVVPPPLAALAASRAPAPPPALGMALVAGQVLRRLPRAAARAKATLLWSWDLTELGAGAGREPVGAGASGSGGASLLPRARGTVPQLVERSRLLPTLDAASQTNATLLLPLSTDAPELLRVPLPLPGWAARRAAAGRAAAAAWGPDRWVPDEGADQGTDRGGDGGDDDAPGGAIPAAGGADPPSGLGDVGSFDDIDAWADGEGDVKAASPTARRPLPLGRASLSGEPSLSVPSALPPRPRAPRARPARHLFPVTAFTDEGVPRTVLLDLARLARALEALGLDRAIGSVLVLVESEARADGVAARVRQALQREENEQRSGAAEGEAPDTSPGRGGRGADASPGCGGAGADANPGRGGAGADASPGRGGAGADASPGRGGAGADASPGRGGGSGPASPAPFPALPTYREAFPISLQLGVPLAPAPLCEAACTAAAAAGFLSVESLESRRAANLRLRDRLAVLVGTFGTVGPTFVPGGEDADLSTLVGPPAANVAVGADGLARRAPPGAGAGVSQGAAIADAAGR